MPEELQVSSSENENLPTNLPAITPLASLVMHRMQTSLGLLHEVVQESSEDYWYEQGKKSNQAAKWFEAEYRLKICLAINSKHWRAALQLAAAFAWQQKVLGAKEAILQSYTHEESGQLWRSFMEELTSEHWQTLQNLLEAQKNSKEPHDIINISIALALVHRMSQTENAWQTLVDIYSLGKKEVNKSALWHRVAGMIWADKEEDGNGNSLSYYDNAIVLNKSYLCAYYERGHIRETEGDYNGALSDFDQVIALNPISSIAYIARGDIKAGFLNEVSDYAGAISDYSSAIEIDKENYSIYQKRGNAKYKLFDFSGALIDYNLAIGLNCDNSSIYIERGKVKFKLQDYAGALLDYNITIKPGDIALQIRYFYHLLDRAEIKYNLKDYQGALEDYKIVSHVHHVLDSKHYNYRGAANFYLGNYSEAISDFSKAIERSSVFSKVYYTNRAAAKEKSGDYKGAFIDREALNKH